MAKTQTIADSTKAAKPPTSFQLSITA